MNEGATLASIIVYLVMICVLMYFIINYGIMLLQYQHTVNKHLKEN